MHHMMAIEMGMVCLENATHEPLRALCDRVISSQREESQMMLGWLADWYGIHYEPTMTEAEMRQLEWLRGLENGEFETEFMQELIQHHQTAVGMGKQCLDNASHDELIQLCDNIIETQRAEIRELTSWLCHWYGQCGPVHSRHHRPFDRSSRDHH